MKMAIRAEQRFILLGSQKGLFKEPLPAACRSAATAPRWKRL